MEELDNGGYMAIVGFIQKEGAEDVIEEGGMVFAGSVAVRVEVHF